MKRKAEDPEAVALVSDDIIAKRQARFKTKEETAEEQRKQRFMDPDTVKATERKERFGKWLPQASGKTTQDDVAAAIGTALDNSVPAKGRGRGRAAAGAPKEEKYSAEFTAKAEVCSIVAVQGLTAQVARDADVTAVSSQLGLQLDLAVGYHTAFVTPAHNVHIWLTDAHCAANHV